MKGLIAFSVMFASMPAFAAPYVFGRVGVSDFILNTSQYVDFGKMFHPDQNLPLSTIVDGKISDVNATYHIGVGYEIDRVRIDVEGSYGRYVMSGKWDLTDVPAGSIQNVSEPATYTLKDSVFTVMANVHYDLLRFGRVFEREMYNTHGDTGAVLTYNSLYLTGGVGMVRVSEKAGVVIDFSKVWGSVAPAYSQDAKDTDTRVAFNLGGGMAIGLAPHVNLDLEYRYTNFGKMSAELVSRKYYSHELSAGLRYTF